jgi:hypothetical protein
VKGCDVRNVLRLSSFGFFTISVKCAGQKQYINIGLCILTKNIAPAKIQNYEIYCIQLYL